uniref:Uncharacterized protein n=1 Tax=Arundo donax TaxID=35708 RepID=A0A0A9ENF9_ARUDO
MNFPSQPSDHTCVSQMHPKITRSLSKFRKQQ